MGFDQNETTRFETLESRLGRLETLLQQLLSLMTTTRSQADQLAAMQTMLQQLRGSAGNFPVASSSSPTLQQEQQMQAIRDAVRSGDNMKAVAAYRALYGVSMQEAQDAIAAM